MRRKPSSVLVCVALSLSFVSLGLRADAAPDHIPFTNDTVGDKPNGFQSVHSAITTFSDGNGEDLAVGDFGNNSRGNSLVVIGDDSSLVMSFSVPQDFLCLNFGNDQFNATDSGDTADLFALNQFIVTGVSTVLMNRNDVMDQRICINDIQLDQAIFLFDVAEPGQPNEIVDDITVRACQTGRTQIGTGGKDTLNGTAGNDKQKGGANNDKMFAGGCRDRMSGGDGRDKMFGGANNDVVSGLAGDDNINGDAGIDQLTGGPGQDRLAGNTADEPFDGLRDVFHTADGEIDTIVFCSTDNDDLTDTDANDVKIDDCA